MSKLRYRPWPVPDRAWTLRMRWHDLCFLHWRVDPAAVAPLIPPGLELETWGGAAWIGVVPFRMTDVSLRGTPRVRPLSDFAELNVRTYVTAQGKPGVWFFSLDATQPLAVRIARRTLRLPYLDARIDLRRVGETVHYQSERTHLGAGPARLEVSYTPIAEPSRSLPGTLEYFLTERYCLYAGDLRGVSRLEVDHEPWPLQTATATVTACTMTQPLGIALPDPPELVHVSRRLDVVAWPPQRI